MRRLSVVRPETCTSFTALAGESSGTTFRNRPSGASGRTIVASYYRGGNMLHLLRKLWLKNEGQDIAEYAVILAVILVLVVGTVRLVGSNANNAFSNAASSLQ